MSYHLKDVEYFSASRASVAGREYVFKMLPHLESIRKEYTEKPSMSDFSTHHNLESNDRHFFPNRIIEIANNQSHFDIHAEDNIVERSII